MKLTLNGTPLLGATVEPTENGVYETGVIPVGNRYKLEIEADGYIPEQVFDSSVSEGEIRELDAVHLVPVASEGMGQITGTVKNAVDNTNIPSLGVYAYRYINNRSDMVKRVYTDQNGVFTLEDLSAGNYTLRFSGRMRGLDGEQEYVSHQTTALSIGGQTTDAEVLITPRLYSSFYIVLNWNEVPYDLDAHLTGPNREDGRFHIYFANQGPNLWQEPYAQLTHDDRDGLGPEIVIIRRLQQGDVYRFSVHDYKNGGSASSAALASSGATVNVYSRDGQSVSFNVPDQEGTLWTVFEIDESGEVNPVNTMGYEVNQGGIRSRARSARTNSVATDYWPIVFQATK